MQSGTSLLQANCTTEPRINLKNKFKFRKMKRNGSKKKIDFSYNNDLSVE